MKRNLLFGVLFGLLLASSLQADDYRWIKGTFTWKGNGTMMTQVIPLYGETYRVNYSSPQKGPLSITLLFLFNIDFQRLVHLLGNVFSVLLALLYTFGEQIFNLTVD